MSKLRWQNGHVQMQSSKLIIKCVFLLRMISLHTFFLTEEFHTTSHLPFSYNNNAARIYLYNYTSPRSIVMFNNPSALTLDTTHYLIEYIGSHNLYIHPRLLCQYINVGWKASRLVKGIGSMLYISNLSHETGKDKV